MDESAHHALVNAGEREIVWKKEGEKKGAQEGAWIGGTVPATVTTTPQ